MGFTVSVILENLGHLDPDISGLEVHGANLTVSSALRTFASDDRVTSFEVFLPPRLMLPVERLAEVSRSVLPAHRQGKGILAFYPNHAIPHVLNDGKPRVLYVLDLSLLAGCRYLRDRYASGPTPIVCDTHALGNFGQYLRLERLSEAPHVPFDSALALSSRFGEALSRTFTEHLGCVDGIPPFRIDVLPHSVDCAVFRPHSEEGKRKIRHSLGLPEAGPVTLYFGRITPNSKADLLPLLLSFNEASKGQGYLLIAGRENTPGYEAMLNAEAASMGIADRVITRTPIPPSERARYFAASDVFVFPGDTIQEAQGTVVNEAAASGLPVIVSDWDGLVDMVEDGVTGFVVPTQINPGVDLVEALSPISDFMTDYLLLAQNVWVDQPKLTSALAQVLVDERVRLRMGAFGRIRAETQVATTVVTDRMFALWQELLEIAADEQPDDASKRRGHALRVGMPTPYQSLFRHYGTSVLNIETTDVALTILGENISKGTDRLRLYDETIPLVQPHVMTAVFDALLSSPFRRIRYVDLVGVVGSKTRVPGSEITFHVGLLLKHGAVTVEPSSD